MMPRLPLVVLSAASLAMVSACGASSLGGQSPVVSAGGISSGTTSTTADSPSSSGSSSRSASSTEPDTAPPTEQSGGTESARPGQGAQPSVEVAQLPIGGNQVAACATVDYEGPADIPAGVRIIVTGVSVQPSSSAAEVGGSGCSGLDGAPCLKYVLVSDGVKTSACNIPIKASGSAGDGTDGHLVLAGRLECPAGHSSDCSSFVQVLLANPQTITVSPPESSQSSPSESPSGSSSSEVSSSADSSSSGT
jgi:hypothetical protein